MGHFSFVDKSYKLLFLIYAPVALATLAFKFFSDVQISYIFLAAIAFLIVSFLIAILIILQYFRHFEDVKKDQQLHIPYTLRHQFLVAFIAIFAVTFLVSGSYGYVLYRMADGNVFPQNTPEQRIVLLIGIQDPLGNRIEGYSAVMAGVNHFIEETPDKTEKYHLSYLDHHGVYDERLKLALQKQIENGAHYFICTSSVPCKDLATVFADMIEPDALEQKDVRLIVTAANLSTIEPIQNLVYKFSANNRDEGDLLAKTAYDNGARKPVFIATDDEYGHDSVQSFENVWQEFTDVEGLQGVYIDKELSSDKVLQRLTETFLIKNGYDSIVIAGNGRELDFLNMQDRVKEKQLYAFSESSFSLLGGLNDVSRLITVRPSYRTDNPNLSSQKDAMVYLTLSKVVHAIELAQSTGESFDSIWNKTNYPALIEFENAGEIDFKITLSIYKPVDDLSRIESASGGK